MLKAARGRVNASRTRCWRNLTDAGLSNGRHCPCTQCRRSKIRLMQAAGARMQAPPAQTYFGSDRGAGAIHLEFQGPATLRLDAARERFQRKRVLAILAISNGAEPIRQLLLKMFFLETATSIHRLATPLRSCLWRAVQDPRQRRGYSRCWSLA